MDVLISCQAPPLVPSYGVVMYHQALETHHAGHLKRIITTGLRHGTGDLPPALIRQTLGLARYATMRLPARGRREFNLVATNVLHDIRAAGMLEPADAIYTWNHGALHTIRRAKKMGMVTFLERASSHILTQNRLLVEEAARHGQPIDTYIPRHTLNRALAEYEEADFIRVPSRFVYDSFLEHGVAEEKLFLVPYGADLERFRAARRQRTDNRFVVVFVGSLQWRKGVTDALEAWKLAAIPNATLVLAGHLQAEARDEVMRYKAELGDAVEIPGLLSDVPQLLADADMFFLPTVEEGSAVAIYEAMAVGLPIVTTMNSGTVGRDGQEVCLVPIRDPQAAAAAIRALYEDEPRRRALGEAARRMSEGLTWECCGSTLDHEIVSRVEARRGAAVGAR